MTAMNSRELDSFIGELVRFYGVERAIYVLSRTIQFSDWDSRFGQAVLDRAGQTDFPDARTPRDENHVDPTTRYVTEIDPVCCKRHLYEADGIGGGTGSDRSNGE